MKIAAPTDLIGLKLTHAHYTCETLMLSFGNERQVSDRKGKLKSASDFELHVQCPHKFVDAAGLQAALQIIGIPAEVVDVAQDVGASWRIKFANGSYVVLLPDLGVGSDEQWRLFQPFRDLPHLIFENGNLRSSRRDT